MAQESQAVAGPETTAFYGVGAFAQHLREALEMAVAQEWKQMVWADTDFQDWPLCERSVIDTLQAWAGKGRSLRLLARRYDVFPQRHPRFVAWRRQWDHIIECRVCTAVPGLDLPSVLWSPHYAVLRLDPERSVGWAGHPRPRLVQLDGQLQECARHGSPGFPSTTLGL